MSWLSYRLLGRQLRKLEERLAPFKEIYDSAGFSEPFIIYLSRWILIGIVAVPSFYVFMFIIHTEILHIWVGFSAILATILATVLALVLVLAVLYYPVYRRYSMRLKIDSQLPFTVGYMAAIASAGISAERMIERAAEVENIKELAYMFTHIVRDIRILGLDTLSALERAASRSPSMLLATFLTGIRDTFITSGDLKSFTIFTARRFIQNKINALRNVVNTLGILAEMYITMMVAAPLMLVIMLSVMSILGGNIMGLPPILIIFLLLMILVPSSAMVILVVIDGVLSRA